ncbi:MAG: hypothetical protein NVS3B10_30000 [Polyangiales bacterium]
MKNLQNGNGLPRGRRSIPGQRASAGSDRAIIWQRSGVVVALPVLVFVGQGQRLDKHLAKTIKKLTWKKEEKVDINGMKGIMLDGDGELAGKNIDLAVLVLDTPSKDKDLFVIAVAEDAKLAAHKDEIRFVFKHLQPASDK